MKRLLSLSMVLLLLLPQPAYAFGKTGHRIVGQIAQNHLTPAASKAVAALIGSQSLAQVANWPDEIRSDPRWKHADPWHYITIEDDQTYNTAPKNPKGDVVKAMRDSEATLRNPDASVSEKREALKFLVHFVGDVHQPLHVGRGEDLGGNTIKVKWFGEVTNLHKVWDTKLIRHQELSFTEYAAFLDQVPKDEMAAWLKGGYLDWVSESKALRALVYDFGSSDQDGDEAVPYLGYGYLAKVSPIINRRLAQGGIRLANLLNRIFQEEEGG